MHVLIGQRPGYSGVTIIRDSDNRVILFADRQSAQQYATVMDVRSWEILDTVTYQA